MSSIAYVTDKKMIEYHRLCGNQNINFWRLANQKQFKDFHPGDLLFLYTRPRRSKKKGFVGYGHFDSIQRMSLKKMWNKFGTDNGYESYEKLEEAILAASRDNKVPEEMNCLYLTNVVFFLSPIYPEEIGIHLANKLESYCYLDQNDPLVTVRILKAAGKVGIDAWSASQNLEPETVFRRDEIRHQLAVCAKEIGEAGYTSQEKARAKRLINEKLIQGYELIRGSSTDGVLIEEDRLTIAIPFVTQHKDFKTRRTELIGKMTLYKIFMKKHQIPIERFRFEILFEQEREDMRELIRDFNHA